MKHELKILPEYFNQIRDGKKTAEIRYDDRGYSTGDVLVLKEWLPRKKRFTGREIEVKTVGLLRLVNVIPESRGFDYVMLSFVPRMSVGCRFKMPEEALYEKNSNRNA